MGGSFNFCSGERLLLLTPRLVEAQHQRVEVVQGTGGWTAR
jgi:hypothetical protein